MESEPVPATRLVPDPPSPTVAAARPTHRPRRLRRTPGIRDAVAEHVLRPDQLVYPVFVVPGTDREEPIDGLPGHARRSPDRLIDHLAPLVDAGLRHVMVFGVPDEKDHAGAALLDPHGAAAEALRALEEAFGDRLTRMADVCLCTHADHGHCGVPHTTQDAAGRTVHHVDGDAALPLLAQRAVLLAEAGAHWVAPSDMMDGRVAAIRSALDDAGHTETAILSYTAKYASAHYGPFRAAAGSTPAFGDRATYQMDPRNAREARREARLDEAEGADMLLVKPGLPYLDILADLHRTTDLPLASYHVSGEYAMVHAAAAQGWADAGAVLREQLGSLSRAGASLILTYASKDLFEEGWQ